MKNPPKLLASILGCELVGFVGAFFTLDSIPTWYAGLEKPFFSPPNWLFGPVWTALYALMGISFYLIWLKGFKGKRAQAAKRLFFYQLALNFIWTPVFFGAKSPSLALLIIVALWVLIIKTIQAFQKISPLAGSLLIPYLLWVTFATLLNLSIVLLN